MLKVLMAAAAVLGMPASVLANNYNFNFHNNSSSWVIDGFYTNENGTWSDNWLRSRITPGNAVEMYWGSQDGVCVVPFRVSWADWGTQDFTMNWCENNPSNIYMKDEGFDWD